MTTYTKLQSGAWGVRAEGKKKVGDVVSVTTKAGAIKQERIEKVLWTGADKHTGATITLCAIESSAGAAVGRRRSRREDDECNCYQCRSGSECLCIYGR